jgi:hypothetical protein
VSDKVVGEHFIYCYVWDGGLCSCGGVTGGRPGPPPGYQSPEEPLTRERFMEIHGIAAAELRENTGVLRALRRQRDEAEKKRDELFNMVNDLTAQLIAERTRRLRAEKAIAEPETEYGIRWRKEDFIMPAGDIGHARTEIHRAASYRPRLTIAAGLYERQTIYGPWRVCLRKGDT